MKRFVVSIVCLPVFAVAALPQWTFDRYKPPKPLPNPYTLQATREQLVTAITQVMEQKEYPVDTQNSKPGNGVIVSQQIIFSKGINVPNDLVFLSDPPAREVRNWTKGRVTFTINVQPVDPNRSTLAIYGKIEGYAQGVLRSEWIECASKGLLEDDLMKEVLKKLNLQPVEQK